MRPKHADGQPLFAANLHPLRSQDMERIGMFAAQQQLNFRRERVW